MSEIFRFYVYTWKLASCISSRNTYVFCDIRENETERERWRREEKRRRGMITIKKKRRINLSAKSIAKMDTDKKICTVD